MPNNNMSHILSRVYNTPLFIEQTKLDAILDILNRRMAGYDVADFTKERNNGEDVECRNVGVINVFGTLVSRSHGMSAMSGMTSYDSLRDQLREHMANDGVAAILFRIDSNGGEANGLFDLVNEIRASSSKKRVDCFVSGHAFSAAYAIASACQTISISSLSGLGSIGVIAQHVDQSVLNEKMGVKFTAVYAGARKNDLTPHEPLSKEGKATLQAMVDDGYEAFCQTVSTNRALSVDDVKKTEAGLYWGQAAIDAKLADSISTWEQAAYAALENKNAVL